MIRRCRIAPKGSGGCPILASSGWLLARFLSVLFAASEELSTRSCKSTYRGSLVAMVPMRSNDIIDLHDRKLLRSSMSDSGSVKI